MKGRMDENNSVDYYAKCSQEELFGALSSANMKIINACLENPAITEAHIIALLRNPYITSEIIRKIAMMRQWMSKYNVKVALVHCPKTPFNISSEYVSYLFWRDLLNVAKNLKIDPRLRIAAERLIIDKLQDLSLGEKIALSRIASSQLIKALIKENDPKIIEELLKNPQVVEEDIIRIINAAKDVYVLASIYNDRKWSFRYNVKKALINNPMTPLHISVNLLKSLLKKDLIAISKQVNLSPALRREAEEVLKTK